MNVCLDKNSENENHGKYSSKAVERRSFSASYPSFQRLVEKGKARAVRAEREMEESYAAPIAPGEIVGKIFYTLDGEKLGETDIKATDGAEKIGFWGIVRRVAQKIISFYPDISENNA